MLDNYVERPDKRGLKDEHVLRDPEWHIVTSIAKETWLKLKSIITDNNELEYMTALESRV
jgi:hypothetical protein